MSSSFGGKDPFDQLFPFGYQPGSRTIEEIDHVIREVIMVNPKREVAGYLLKKKVTGGSFHASCGFAYGGPRGWDHTYSESWMAGADGVFFAEMKEDDIKTDESLHTISKGIRGKGQSFMKKKKPDGNVDSMLTLHNLNEDELTGFEENWNASAAKYLPNWNISFNPFENGGGNWIGLDGSWDIWFECALVPTEPYGDTSAEYRLINSLERMEPMKPIGQLVKQPIVVLKGHTIRNLIMMAWWTPYRLYKASKKMSHLVSNRAEKGTPTLTSLYGTCLIPILPHLHLSVVAGVASWNHSGTRKIGSGRARFRKEEGLKSLLE